MRNIEKAIDMPQVNDQILLNAELSVLYVNSNQW